MGFHHSFTYSSFFIYHHGVDTTWFLFYVDGIFLIVSSTTLVQFIIALLSRVFSMTDLGPLNYFLGVLATRSPHVSSSLRESMLPRSLSELICFSIIQIVCMPRLLISWMPLDLLLPTCLFIVTLSVHSSILLSLVRTLLLRYNISVYSCMTHMSHTCTPSSALCATFEGLWTTIYNFMSPPRLTFVSTRMQTGASFQSLAVRLHVIVFFLRDNLIS